MPRDDWRHLIICCDGTWNRDDQADDGVPTPTNVRLFHNALAGSSDGHDQRVRYFSGVGADGSLLSRTVDGGTGHGLSRNIMNAYLWLATEWRSPRDRIAVVGFSRGAFTARSLIGMVTTCGLLAPDPSAAPGSSWAKVHRLFHEGYVLRDSRADSWSEGLDFHPHFEPPPGHVGSAGFQEVEEEYGRRVGFIGVWDTVGALGIPDSLGLLDLFDDEEHYAFHDTALNPGVRVARHAIALDERRGPFAPTPWTTPDGEIEQDAPRVVQRWFPGAHSDVGGGYRDHGLADGALRWMIDEATDAGLAFDPEACEQIHPDPYDVLHDSCVGVYQRLSPVPRSVPCVDGTDDAAHRSAVDRRTRPPLRQDRYRPSRRLHVGEHVDVDVYAHRPWNETGLWLDVGTYSVQGRGEWLDRTEPAGPDGLTDPGPIERLARAAASALGSVEALVQRVRPAAELPLTKRVESAAWMQLVGFVANGGFHEEKDDPRPPQVEALGSEPVRVRIEHPGYLYAFANDAWGMYGNNRGTVTLTVTRTA